MERSLSKVAQAYVAYHAEPHEWTQDLVLQERDRSHEAWAIDYVFDQTFESPGWLWEFVLELLSLDPPDPVLEVLAAGPLEDYLAKLGTEVIEQVEARAKVDRNWSAPQVLGQSYDRFSSPRG